jgi:hypothetical protein
MCFKLDDTVEYCQEQGTTWQISYNLLPACPVYQEKQMCFKPDGTVGYCQEQGTTWQISCNLLPACGLQCHENMANFPWWNCSRAEL